MMTTSIRIAIAAFAATFALSGSALAQSDPTSAQYDDSVAQVEQVGGGPVAPAASTQSPPEHRAPLQSNLVGGLPFTGLDAIALAAVALALLSLGFALRRLTWHHG